MSTVMGSSFKSPAHAIESLKSLGEQHEFEVAVGDTERQAELEERLG
jgi:hypothetical protein